MDAQWQGERNVEPYYAAENITLWQGDCRTVLAQMEAESVQTCVTSPPYWNLRIYDGVAPSVWGGNRDCEHLWDDELSERRRGREHGANATVGNTLAGVAGVVLPEGRFCRRCGAWLGTLGNEPTLGLYIEHLVEVFRAVRRVLRGDGTLWLNMGDSFASRKGSGLRPKDLLLLPFRVAMALQADGWYLRSAAPWVKRNTVPESVTDRPSIALEYVFLLSKSERYFYDSVAVRKPIAEGSAKRYVHAFAGDPDNSGKLRLKAPKGSRNIPAGRNRRNTDWFYESLGMLTDDEGLPLGFDINTYPSKLAHFASFPRKLVEPCILAGTSQKGCCPVCGKAWVREVEMRKPDKTTTRGLQPWAAVTGQRDTPAGGFPRRQIIPLGWRPACNCPHTEADVVPCKVLDPFSGTGTTMMTAWELGRHGIGIELSEEYCRMSVVDRQPSQRVLLGE